jgi:hypothetical protein
MALALGADQGGPNVTGALDSLPAWPVVYSSIFAMIFLLLSAARLWHLRLAYIKVKSGGNSYIKAVCFHARNSMVITQHHSD